MVGRKGHSRSPKVRTTPRANIDEADGEGTTVADEAA
jgi:hypothetical protein